MKKKGQTTLIHKFDKRLKEFFKKQIRSIYLNQREQHGSLILCLTLMGRP